MAAVVTSRLCRLRVPNLVAAPAARRNFCFVTKPGQPPVGQKEDWSQGKPNIVLPKQKVHDPNPLPFTTNHQLFDWTQEHQAAQEQVYVGQRGLMRNNVGPQVGPFGTLENPVEIMSNYDSRVVGCVGGEGDKAHSLRWFNLRKGRLHSCYMCSQVYTLTNEPIKSMPINMPIEDPEGLGREEFELYGALSWANFERMGVYDAERPDVIDIYADREARRKIAMGEADKQPQQPPKQQQEQKKAESKQ